MTRYEKLRDLVIGAPLDPLSQKTRQHIALAAFLAWVGLGADGCRRRLWAGRGVSRARAHTHIACPGDRHRGDGVHYSLAYNSHRAVSDGGGGYRVATSLIGPRAGSCRARMIVD